jgi:acetyl-CoA carboxylase carboxyl transferase subunit alpha
VEAALDGLDGMSPEALRQARRAKFLAMGRV